MRLYMGTSTTLKIAINFHLIYILPSISNKNIFSQIKASGRYMGASSSTQKTGNDHELVYWLDSQNAMEREISPKNYLQWHYDSTNLLL